MKNRVVPWSGPWRSFAGQIQRFVAVCTLFLLAAVLPARAQVVPAEFVYQNIAAVDSQPAPYYGAGENGDEITIAGGVARKVASFGFLYYGDFAGAGPTATIRFYKNDGPDVDPGSSTVRAPGTLLYESDPIALSPGYHEALASGLAIDVPVSFTWTVQFSGVSQTAGNRAGLIFTTPPTTGSSFNDYWAKQGGSWDIFSFGGTPVANFDARVQAYTSPLSLKTIANVSTPKSTTTPDIAINIVSVVADPGALTVTATADNKTLVPDSGIAITGDALSLKRVLKITPASGQSGVANINVAVSSATGLSAKTSFVLRVTDGANPVQISLIPDQTLAVGQASGNIPFQVFGLTEAGGLGGANFISDNQTLLPDFRIIRDIVDLGAGKFWVRVEPVDGVIGVATVTVEMLTFSGAKGTTKFKVTVGDPATLPVITIAAQANAAEPFGTGSFIISRTGDTTMSMLVYYTATGTATANVDYRLPESPILIYAGSASVVVPVQAYNDLETESPETVTVTLGTNVFYKVGAANSATVTIEDDDAVLPVVRITATETNVTEGGTGHLTVSRTGPVMAPLTVNYIVRGSATGGADFTSLPGSLTLPIGAATADISLVSLDDTLTETNETVIVTLTATGPYEVGTPNNATIAIVDNDSLESPAKITRQPADVTTGAGLATLTVAASGTAPLTYKWTLNGDPIINGGAFSDATTATLKVNVTSSDQSGDYQVEVANAFGKDLSRVAKLVIRGEGGQPPEIFPIADQTTEAGKPLVFSIVAVDPEGAKLIFKGRSDKPELLDAAGFSFVTIDNFFFTTTLTPKAGQTGVANVTITTSDGFNLAEARFKLTVTGSANTPPTISTIPNQTLAFGTVTGELPFTTGDAETPNALTVTGASSNQALVPDASVVFGGTGTNRTVKVSPIAGQSGTTTITVTVKDAGNATKTATFTVTVNANTPPTISTIPNQTLAFGTVTGELPFTTGDAETPNALTVTGASSNQALVPDASVVFGGTGTNRTVKVSPVAGQSGTTTITVTVKDAGNATKTATFTVTVDANTPPTISTIPNQTLAFGTVTGELPFTTGDAETPNALTVTGASSNQALVPDASVVFGGTGTNRTVKVSPIAGQSGTATITVTVKDAGNATRERSFTVTVNANAAPTISDISNQTLAFRAVSGLIPFTVGDAETAPAALVVTASSSDKTLVPDEAILLAGSGADRTIKVSPRAGKSGTATITVTVKDAGNATKTGAFTVTVSPNSLPTISNIADRSVTNGTPMTPVAFTIGDANESAEGLRLTATSSRPAVIPPANVVFGGSGSNRTVMVTPVAGTNGTVVIRLTVEDSDGGVGLGGFVVTVAPPPVLTPEERFVNHLFWDLMWRRPSADELNAYAGRLNSGALSRSGVVEALSIDQRALGLAGLRAFWRFQLRSMTTNELQTLVIPLLGQLAQDERALWKALICSPEYFENRADRDNSRWIDAMYMDLLGRQAEAGIKEWFLPYLNSGGKREDLVTLLLANLEEFHQRLANQLYQAYLRRSPDSTELGATVASLKTGRSIREVVTGLLSTSEYFNQTEAARVNRAPFVPGQTLVTTAGTPIKFALIGTDPDLDIVVSQVIPPQPQGAGQLTGETTLFTFSPAAGFTGEARFFFLAVDSNSKPQPEVSEVRILVLPDTNAPVISAISAQIMAEDGGTREVAFTVNDGPMPADAVRLEATSGNPALLPATGIVLGGSGTNRMVKLTPAANQNGETTVKLVATDGGGLKSTNEFRLTVTPVNDAPTISSLAAVETGNNLAVGPLKITVGDVDGDANALVLKATVDSSNPGLLPAGAIIFGGAGTNRTVTLTPAVGQSGSAVVTLSVSDGLAETKTTFRFTARPAFPVFTKELVPITATNGDTVVLEAEVAGSVTEYLWRKNGGDFIFRAGGAKSSRLVLSNVSPSDAGGYTLEARNEFGNKTSYAVLTVKTPPAIVIQPENLTVAIGTNVSLSVIPWSYKPVTYGWFKTGGAASITNAATLALGNASAATIGSYFCVVSNVDGVVTSRVATVKVLLPPVITRQPASQAVALGDAVTLDVAVTGAGPLSYRWRKNGVNLDAGTNQSLVLSNVQIADGGMYSVAVQGPDGAATSEGAIIKPDLASSTLANGFASRLKLDGNSGSVNGIAVGGTVQSGEDHGPGSYSSFWFRWVAPRDGQLILDTKGSSYDTVLDAFNDANSFPTIDTLSLLARDDEAGGFHTSQIRIQVTAGKEYQIAVTARRGDGSWMFLNWRLDVDKRLPVITRQPVSATADYGIPVKYSIEASGPAQAGPIRVEWFGNPGLDNTFLGTGKEISSQSLGTDIFRLLARVSNDDGYVDSAIVGYRLRSELYYPLQLHKSASEPRPAPSGNGGLAKSSLGGVEAAVETSAGATLVTLTTDVISAPGEPAHCGVIGGASQWFTYRPPADGVLTIDTDGSSFDTVLAVYTGDPADFSTLAPVTCDDNSGTNGLTSKVTFSVKAGTDYHVAMDGAGGATGLLLVTYRLSAPLAIPAIPSQTLTAGQPSTPIPLAMVATAVASSNILVTASASNRDLIPYSGLALSGTGTNLNLIITPAVNQAGNAIVTVMATDGVQVSSRSFEVTVIPGNSAPRITSLEDVVVTPGFDLMLGFVVDDRETTASNLVVTASSANPAVIAAKDLRLGGAGFNRTISLATTGTSGSAVITLTVKDADGATTATSFTVTTEALAGPPVITTRPISQSIVLGGTVTFTVAASGAEPLGYQWQFNGQPIAGATGSTLTFTNVDFSLIGDFSVSVTNSSGGTTASANLNVILPPVPDPVLTGQLVNGEFQLLVENLPLGLGFKLQASENLADWTDLATFTSEFGIAAYTDEVPQDATRRFYRVIPATAQ